MLAELLASSYIPYKEDTTAFTTRLSKEVGIQNRSIEKRKARKRILAPLQFLAQVSTIMGAASDDRCTNELHRYDLRKKKAAHARIDKDRSAIGLCGPIGWQRKCKGSSNEHSLLFMVTSIIYQWLRRRLRRSI